MRENECVFGNVVFAVSAAPHGSRGVALHRQHSLEKQAWISFGNLVQERTSCERIASSEHVQTTEYSFFLINCSFVPIRMRFEAPIARCCTKSNFHRKAGGQFIEPLSSTNESQQQVIPAYEMRISQTVPRQTTYTIIILCMVCMGSVVLKNNEGSDELIKSLATSTVFGVGAYGSFKHTDTFSACGTDYQNIERVCYSSC